MALSAGSVTTASDGTPSGSGLALALYQQRKLPVEANLAPAIAAGLPIPGSFWSGIAAQCNADATAIVSHITANALVTVTVTTSDAGLQRMPLLFVENEPTKAPGSNKTITGTIA